MGRGCVNGKERIGLKIFNFLFLCFSASVNSAEILTCQQELFLDNRLYIMVIGDTLKLKFYRKCSFLIYPKYVCVAYQFLFKMNDKIVGRCGEMLANLLHLHFSYLESLALCVDNAINRFKRTFSFFLNYTQIFNAKH